MVDEQLHALALAADVRQPFVFPDLGLHDVQIGEDERQRGLELVVCVGDELLLLFVALRHRAHCAPRDQDREHQDEQRAAQQHQKGGKQLAEGHILLHIAVDKDKHGACLTRDSLVAVVGHPAALVPFRCRAGRKIRDLLLRNGGNRIHVHLRDLPVFVQPDGEKPRAEPGLLGDHVLIREPIGQRRAAGRLEGRKHAVVRGDRVGQRIQDAVHLHHAGNRLKQEDARKHQQDRDRIDQDEFFSQREDHALSSST